MNNKQLVNISELLTGRIRGERITDPDLCAALRELVDTILPALDEKRTLMIMDQFQLKIVKDLHIKGPALLMPHVTSGCHVCWLITEFERLQKENLRLMELSNPLLRMTKDGRVEMVPTAPDITLRQRYAGLAMQALLTGDVTAKFHTMATAQSALTIVDATIAALELK